MRVTEIWSHDIVLKALCDDIARRRAAGLAPDFILVTGDLGFSGKADEYRLVEEFFDALINASGVPKELIFCIPGNHDIDRERQKMCFYGTRDALLSINHVDAFLQPNEDLETLLKRQENYWHFLTTYCENQNRTPTPDGLGYVSLLVIDNIRLAIIALNSAWLAEGGNSDHGKLIVGERQLIDALDIAKKQDPHIIITMAHHPPHLLQDFDRRPVQSRIEKESNFFHCGHLHAPEIRNVGREIQGCLFIAAGASFETRQSTNSYSVITLDILNAKRSIHTIKYDPQNGTFSISESEEYSIHLTSASKCGVGELASALRLFSPPLSSYSHYLAALLLDVKSEFPIPTQNGYIFASLAMLQVQPESAWKQQTLAFKSFSNVLRVFYGRISLADILQSYGDPVAQYGKVVQETSNSDMEFQTRLAVQERDSKMFMEAVPREDASYAVALLAKLASDGDWNLLSDYGARYMNSPESPIAIYAKRMTAFGLAHSSESREKMRALELYQSLVSEGLAEASDVATLALLLANVGKVDEAKAIILEGLEKFEATDVHHFSDIGLNIVSTTGDREFRKRLESALTKRSQRD